MSDTPRTEPVTVSLACESWAIRGEFRISRASKTQADTVVCRLDSGGTLGQGECVPYPHYGETVDGVRDLLASATEGAASVQELIERCASMPAGAARNALDCALWDLVSKLDNRRAHVRACRQPPRPVPTALTLSLDTPENMADAARHAANRSILKIKLGGPDDIACMHAVAANAPNSRIIVDANEAWTPDILPQMMREAARMHIALIEQPLPAGDDACLDGMPHPVPVCADESAHTAADLEALAGRYDCINIKLDKAGGLTQALIMRDRARELGFGIMIGCMVGTSLSMAPAVLLAQDADYVDLDGPLHLVNDRQPHLDYMGELVSPPDIALWG